ncbi:type I restriction-modification system subunit M [Granulicatella balaenopterae]
MQLTKQQLAAKIWNAANQMRSKIEANEYKDYILGFMFYKYISEKEEEVLTEDGATRQDMKEYLVEGNSEMVEYLQDKIGYFISYDNLFSTWLEKGKDFDIADVREALSAFNRLIGKNHKDVFEGIFNTLDTGLSNLGSTAGKQTKAVLEIIKLIKEIPMDANHDYDVLGFVYEYLISMFAANAGKKAGEFYTPHEVSVLMSDIVAEHLKDKEEIKIYDPTSGSGSLLINIGQSVTKHNGNRDSIQYYAQELKSSTYNLTRMNLVMRGINPSNIITRNADTLVEDWPLENANPNEFRKQLRVDAVVSNPPYSQKWNHEEIDENDPRYDEFGMAPTSKADFAFLLHDLYHVEDGGIMTIVLPHGVLFRGGEEGKIRRNLIEKNHIDAIIGLPANIFFGTGIPTIVMVLKRTRDENDTLIIDASENYIKEGTNNKLRSSDIKRIVDAIKERKDIENFARVVSREEIRENDYNLNIPRYVSSADDTDTWDIYATMAGGIPIVELEQFNDYWTAFPSLRNELFVPKTEKHVELISEDLTSIFSNNQEIKNYKQQAHQEFDSFKAYLSETLLTNIEELNIATAEEQVVAEMFKRLNNIPLVDKYQVYQVLADAWKVISGDIELIKQNGQAIITQVEPNMVEKTKSNKKVEVQEGWKGTILPFDLVAKVLLTEQTTALATNQDRLNQIIAEKQEIFESLSEEDFEELEDILNANKTNFTKGDLNKFVKELLKAQRKSDYDEDSIEYKCIHSKDLADTEAELKKTVKEKEDELHVLTKATTESLTPEQITELLEVKWFAELLTNINQFPTHKIDELHTGIKNIIGKYATTLSDIDKEIHETEQKLSSLLDDLVADEEDMMGINLLKELLGES